MTGAISFSVWQGIEVEYLLSGRKYSQDLKQIYEDYMVKYGFDGNDTFATEGEREFAAWGYKYKIRQALGQRDAEYVFQTLIGKIVAVCEADPTVHVKIMADLLDKHYAAEGARSPLAIRSYFMLPIQKNLNPANWLAPVRFANDIPPADVNGWTDNNAWRRGDYGKQVMLGNTYNDRGILYWYGVTRDRAAIDEMIRQWSGDPARLKQSDYQLLKDGGYLRYYATHPDVYHYLMGILPGE